MTNGMLLRLYALLMVTVATAGCQLIEGIFRAGMWVGILMVLLVLGLVFALVSRVRR